MHFRGKTWGVSRVLWTLLRGEIPKGKCVLHTCDFTSCMNIDHLFLGSHLDNMQDKMKKGRHVAVGSPGVRNGQAKLTQEAAKAIRAMRGEKTQQEIADHITSTYTKISRSQVGNILRGKQWK